MFNVKLMYAVVELKWHQYIVKEWDTITVDKVKEGEKIDVENVLLCFDEKWDKIVLWKPYVKKAKIDFEIVENIKWEKMRVVKFKRKNRYHRVIGFRPKQTILKIKKILVNE